MTSRFVVFGASGDLTRRYLMPALVRLHAAGRLAGDLGIVGAARDAWDTEVFRRRIGEGLARHAADVPAQARAELVRRRQIAVHFRPVPHLVFGATPEPVSNVLAFSLDPDRCPCG
jgi:glucose-6-phosphate 1-dehydrogenase